MEYENSTSGGMGGVSVEVWAEYWWCMSLVPVEVSVAMRNRGFFFTLVTFPFSMRLVTMTMIFAFVSTIIFHMSSKVCFNGPKIGEAVEGELDNDTHAVK